MFFSSERRHADVLSICINGDFPIQIGPVDPRPDGVEACNDIRRRVTEWVAAAAADERDLRMPGLQ